MKFQVASSFPAGLDAVVVRLKEGEKRFVSRELNVSANRAVNDEIKQLGFKGGLGEVVVLRAPAGAPAKRIIVAGVGKQCDPEQSRKTTAAVIQQARKMKLQALATGVGGVLGADGAARYNVEGALLGDYEFDKYKKSDKPRRDIRYTFVADTAAGRRAAAAGMRRGQIGAEAAILARDLVNEPANAITPTALARVARDVARRNGLRFSVMGRAEIRRAGLTAYLAVSLGSDQPPQFIRLQYIPPGSATGRKHVVLVGKGITYDAGGINIKPSRGGMLEAMKMDMAGGAAVIAAMSALKRLGVKHKVTAYVPATENLLGGGAYKPGDIWRTFDGRTIEIGNTDAEGRVTLVDALAYAAKKDKPDEMIDLATVTDTELSLGPDYAAIFANDDLLKERLTAAGEASGEKVWELPAPDDYDEMTKSPVADFSNIVTGRAYTLSVPLLLKHFVGKAKWSHLDIGGPASSDKDRGYLKKGGTGFGTRLLLEYLQR